MTLLQNNIKIVAARRYHERKWICILKTSAPHDLNTEIGDYAKEMYNFCQFSNELLYSYDNKKYDIYQTELEELSWFPECNCLTSSFLFTSFYNIMLSWTSVICLDSRTRRSAFWNVDKKHFVFYWSLNLVH